MCECERGWASEQQQQANVFFTQQCVQKTESECVRECERVSERAQPTSSRALDEQNHEI